MRLSLHRIGRFHGQFFVMLQTIEDDADVSELIRGFKTVLRVAALERPRAGRLPEGEPLDSATGAPAESRDAA